MLKLIQVCALIFTLTASFPIFAEWGTSMGSGYGAADLVPLRIGLQKTWCGKWGRGRAWRVGGYWDLSAFHMTGQQGEEISSNKQLNGISYSGVFRWKKNDVIFGQLKPFIDIGIGITYLSEREVGGRKLGMNSQFEDRAGIGILFGQHDQFELGYRFVHYSNAYIGQDNHGINLHMLILGYWFI